MVSLLRRDGIPPAVSGGVSHGRSWPSDHRDLQKKINCGVVITFGRSQFLFSVPSHSGYFPEGKKKNTTETDHRTRRA
jgi:hypothetical protein